MTSHATAATSAASRVGMVETVRPFELAGLVLQLGSIALVIYQFSLETSAFLSLVLLTIPGFVVHYFLPFRLRLAFFTILSLAAILMLLGPLDGAWLIGLSLGLIGVAQLPIALSVRVGLLLVIGLALGLLRTGWTAVPWPTAIWPVLGSMFMFRMAAYLYDVKHQPSLAGFWPTLSYFFLLPNVAFPLFPVVDYSTYRREYYSDERHRIYRVGVLWMCRGVVQLILYKAVYQVLVRDPSDVENVVDLARYMLWPFLLYLRVSGQFHVIAGMLRLFGFKLPETHHEYYLTSSFTDFWRRINIYWKDFMLKVVYTPTFFSLRRRGETTALVVATALVFVVTWVLHSYQWFWITGASLFAWNDVLFWSILGVCVIVNSVREWRRGRQRRLAPSTATWGQTMGRVVRTLAMFTVISVLWSLWTTESVQLWLSLWSAAARGPAPGQGPTMLLIAAVPATIALWVVAEARGWLRREPTPPPLGSAATVLATTVCLVLLSWSAVYARLGPVGTLVAAVRYGGLNEADAVNLERGYYENLMAGNRFNGELWSLYMNRPPEWSKSISELGLARPAEGLPWELVPSSNGRFKGAVLQTNQWGMHDKDYTRERPAGCYRIALLGASHAMGTGVDRDETFEARLETRLNSDGDRCVEVLNFSVYGYQPVDQIALLEKRVIGFDPNAILYVGHPGDVRRVVLDLAQAVIRNEAPPYEALADIVRRAGVDASDKERTAVQKLAPFGDEILSVVHRRLVSFSREHGVCAGWLFLPMVPDRPNPALPAAEIAIARESGFIVLDLSDVYAGANQQALFLAPWDAHPNSEGNRLVGERLYSVMKDTGRELLHCGESAAAGAVATGGATPASLTAR